MCVAARRTFIIGVRVKPVETIEFDLKQSRGYQVDRAKPSQAQNQISRYTKNKVLFSVPCAYVREVVILLHVCA